MYTEKHPPHYGNLFTAGQQVQEQKNKTGIYQVKSNIGSMIGKGIQTAEEIVCSE
jgi:hypothetical protein